MSYAIFTRDNLADQIEVQMVGGAQVSGVVLFCRPAVGQAVVDGVAGGHLGGREQFGHVHGEAELLRKRRRRVRGVDGRLVGL